MTIFRDGKIARSNGPYSRSCIASPFIVTGNSAAIAITPSAAVSSGVACSSLGACFASFNVFFILLIKYTILLVFRLVHAIVSAHAEGFRAAPAGLTDGEIGFDAVASLHTSSTNATSLCGTSRDGWVGQDHRTIYWIALVGTQSAQAQNAPIRLSGH